MRLSINYGNGIISLPASVTEYINKATKRDIQILLILASADTATLADGDNICSWLASETGIKKTDIESSISFWLSTGIISDAETAPRQTSADNVQVHKIIKPQTAPPRYSTAEIASVLEGRKDLPGLIDECQSTFGKIFNSHEVGVIVSLLDYLGVEGDYILVLLTYCKKNGKLSLHYAEKIAYEMYDEGVFSSKELETRLAAKELAASLEGKVRKLFGIKDRSFTTKEMVFIGNWASVFNYDISVIKHAYEITVNAINEPSIPYTNAILEKWNSLGLRTIDDITAFEKASENTSAPSGKQKNSKPVKLGNSFDTDEFFEAALRRSLGEE